MNVRNIGLAEAGYDSGYPDHHVASSKEGFPSCPLLSPDPPFLSPVADELEPLGFAPAESVAAITCVELRVPCGSPSPIGEGSVGKVDLNRMLVKNPLATFLVRCTGTAMTAAGIEFGDVCIVDRSLDARSGDIVLAYINARFTMRRYEEYGEDGRRLVPVTEITDKDDFNIEGVVTGLCRKF